MLVSEKCVYACNMTVCVGVYMCVYNNIISVDVLYNTIILVKLSTYVYVPQLETEMIIILYT